MLIIIIKETSLQIYIDVEIIGFAYKIMSPTRDPPDHREED